jgi:hypothetical protein
MWSEKTAEGVRRVKWHTRGRHDVSEPEGGGGGTAPCVWVQPVWIYVCVGWTPLSLAAV